MAQLNISRQPDYTDLDLDFKINPITGDINKKKVRMPSRDPYAILSLQTTMNDHSRWK